MKQDYTDITVLLDRSGSMRSIASDTIGGFNAFIADQASEPGDCRITLIQFDSHDPQQVDFCAIPVQEVVPLTSRTFEPRGTTPLLDALGASIVATGKRLAEMDEAERPGQVVFVIITDGLENASRTYGRRQVFDMIRHQEEVYKWNFLYLGANQDAIGEAMELGIDRDRSMTFVTEGKKVEAMFDSTSKVVKKARLRESVAFSLEDRERQD